jgi:hypothetical protein
MDPGDSPYAAKAALHSEVRASIEAMNIPIIRFEGNSFSG